MNRFVRVGLSAAFLTALSTAAVFADPAPNDHVRSPDGRLEVWAPAGCHCVWGLERGATPKKLFEIRGAVGKIVWSPDGTRIAFENPRGDWTVEAARGSPAMEGFSPARYYGWGFIATYDFAANRIGYVDPEFATDTDPKWENASTISFTRHAEEAKDARLTRPAPALDAAAATVAPGSPASFLETPLVYQPAVSADGSTFAYVTREGTARSISVGAVHTLGNHYVVYRDDDGRALSDIALSPHGDVIAYVRGARPNKLDDIPNPRSLPRKPRRELWVGGLANDQSPHLAAEGEAPQFTPDGGSLVFEGDKGLMIAPVQRRADGSAVLGEISVLIPGLANDARFSPDGSRLVFNRGGGLFVYDLASDRTAPIEHPKGASDFSAIWSPDGRRLVFIRTNQARDFGYTLGYDGPVVADKPWSIELYDVAAHTVSDVWQAKAGVGSSYYALDQDATETGHPSDQLLWADGDRIIFAWESDGWRHLYAVRTAGGDAVRLTSGDGEVESAALMLDRKSIVIATNIGDLGRRHLSRVDVATATVTPMTSGEADQWGASPMEDGAVAYVQADWDFPPMIAMFTPEAMVTIGHEDPNISIDQMRAMRKWVKPQLITLTASDGATAYGQLFVPAHPNGCGVVFAHGGIKRQMLPGFHYMDAYSVLYETNQYLASKDCVVLSVEYRSSIMRGYAFRNAPGWGSAGASEMLDVAAAGTYLKAHPELKVRHVGIYGLSWGGYITAQALTRYPDIFEAGFDMAGVHEFFGDRTPNSPEARIADLRAPIYLVQGDDDRNVDFYQGLSLAALLRAQGADVTLKAVPDEVHDMTSTFANMVDVYGSGADFLYDHLTKSTKSGPRRK